MNLYRSLVLKTSLHLSNQSFSTDSQKVKINESITIQKTINYIDMAHIYLSPVQQLICKPFKISLLL